MQLRIIRTPHIHINTCPCKDKVHKNGRHLKLWKRWKRQKCCIYIWKRLTIGPSSRPLAPRSWEPGLLIARTGIPVAQLKKKKKMVEVTYYSRTKSYDTPCKIEPLDIHNFKQMPTFLSLSLSLSIFSFFFKKKFINQTSITYRWPVSPHTVATASWMELCHLKACTKPEQQWQ